jgi:hypothetical protein
MGARVWVLERVLTGLLNGPCAWEVAIWSRCLICGFMQTARACTRLLTCAFPQKRVFFFYRLALWHVRVALFLLSTKRSPCMIRVCIEGVSCCPRHPEGGGPWARNRPFWCMFVCTQIDALSSTGLRAPPPNTHTHSTHPPFGYFQPWTN